METSQSLLPIEVKIEEKKVVKKEADYINLKSFSLQNDEDEGLSVSFRNGNPRFTVHYKNNLSYEERQKLPYLEREGVAPYNFGEFASLIKKAKEVVAGTLGSFSFISLYDYNNAGEKVKERLPKAEITIFKNEEDVICIEFLNFMNNKKSLFKIMPSKWFKIKVNGHVVPNETFSLAESEMLFKYLDSALDTLFKYNIDR